MPVCRLIRVFAIRNWWQHEIWAACSLLVFQSHAYLLLIDFTVRRYALHSICNRNSVCPSVRPSVRMSVTLVDCVHMVRPRIMIFSVRQHAERAICYRKSVCLSVCPSVCLSVTRVDQSKTVERIIEILSPPDRPNILVFRHQRSLRKSDGFTDNGGIKYKGGSKN